MIVRIVIAAILLVALGGCATLGYYAQSVGGQMDLWRRERPISAWLNDPNADPALKQKLQRAIEIREFASRELKLPDNGSYRNYADLHRPYVVWNVFAAEAFSIKPKESCFLLVGCVGYRGYFAQQNAERYAEQARSEGLDVYVGGVPAYSTLGWFDDPVLNTFINYPETELARIVFHELAHQVVYVKDDSMFNESFAVAVELEGIRRWLDRHGSESMRAAFDLGQRRKQDFVGLIEKYRARLDALYASALPDDQKRARKREVFSALDDEYRKLKTSWGGFAGYDRILGRDPNNATLASVAIYTRFVPAFDALIEREGRDMTRFYAAAKEISKLARSERDARLQALAPSPQVPVAGASEGLSFDPRRR